MGELNVEKPRVTNPIAPALAGLPAATSSAW